MATVLLTTLLNTATHMKPTVAAATTHHPILLHSFCFPEHFALSNTLYNYWFILPLFIALKRPGALSYPQPGVCRAGKATGLTRSTRRLFRTPGFRVPVWESKHRFALLPS